MKKIYKVLTVMAIPAFLIFYSFSSGSPGGKTGSPGDAANCTACHIGTPINTADWIRSTIPEGGYIPGETYIITARGMHEGVGKFGFELTAESAAGAKKGTFEVTDVVRTQITATGNSVTHTQNGNTPEGDSINWSMDWTAPVAGSGQVRFYAAINAANGNGENSGDAIHLTMLSVEENITIAVDENHLENPVAVYPNPATSSVNISVPEDAEIQIFDLSGKIILNIKDTKPLETIDVSGLEKGIYFVRVAHNGQTYSNRLLKN